MKRIHGLLVAALLSGCQPTPPALPVSATGQPGDARAAMRAFSPLPPMRPDPTNPVADSEAAARLGRRLFYDAGYSRDGSVSCATCHQPEKAFADGRGVAVALGEGSRNTPTLLLAGRVRWQGWGGRGDSLWSQAIGAMENPVEMDADRVTAARRLLSTEAAAYRELFGAPPDVSTWPATGRPGQESYDALPEARKREIEGVVARVGQAMGAFIRRLEPGPSAFDRYVAGDDQAMSASAVRGFGVFAGPVARCAECHAGPMFTDEGFHNVGVAQSRGIEVDHGRATDLAKLARDPFNGAGPHAASAVPVPSAAPDDDGRFRTPSLRHVAATAPYWHMGTGATLDVVVDFDLAGGGAFIKPAHRFPGTQDEKLRPAALSAGERADLLAFLGALTMGEVPSPWGERP